MTKYWDNDTCNCYCRNPEDCSSGEYFSSVTCKCEAIMARSGFKSAANTEEGLQWPAFTNNLPPHRRRKPIQVPLI
ncbi:uncharacterized protein [Cherax quadricarinatus]|uniref:uncharacterized protein n=1 Tax=Cherax quadricarinatus TaxID=27406 RepID=UPI00387EE035